MTHDTHELMQEWDAAITSWPASPSFGRAVARSTQHLGYSASDVEGQLRHVVARCRASVMRTIHDSERPPGAAPPHNVLILASGGVPGLVLEPIAAALVVGAHACVRASQDECVLEPMLEHLVEGGATRVHDRISRYANIEEASGARSIDAAIIYGSDETIAQITRRLDPRAAARVAGYGSRSGIAVVDAASAAVCDAAWASSLADDILTFRQRGCMSPSWLFVLGASDLDAAHVLTSQLGRALAARAALHRGGIGAIAAQMVQRRATDADILGAIAAGTSPDPRVIYSGDAHLTVVPVENDSALGEQVAMLGSSLQTAVLVADGARRIELELLLRSAGCTRVVDPGMAHRPDPLWRHDGIGRIAPLYGPAEPDQ